MAYYVVSTGVPEHRAVEQRIGMKRTYDTRSREDQRRSSTGGCNIPQTLYTNGWIPPGGVIAVKRPASPSFGYTELTKVPRMDGMMRSSSTSSMASLMSSPSPLMSSTVRNTYRSTVPSSSRSVSLSEVETRSSNSDSKNNSRTYVSGKMVTTKGKHKQSTSDTPPKSEMVKKKVGNAKDSVAEKELVEDTESSTMNPKLSDEMSRRIWSYYVQNKQTKVEEAVKEDLRLELETCIRELYPYASLILGGSSLNGFGAKGCDADFCLYLSDSPISQQYCRQTLVQLRGHFQRRANISNLKVIFAKVPIIKFSHRYRDLECDLNINHLTGVRNTVLMQMYSRLDWRVAPLVILIKQWAKNHGINDASQGSLSSYSYVLMIINYLQVGCKPPVLSSVQTQDWGARMFADGNKMQYCWNRMYDTSLPLVRNNSQNTQDLYSLLKGFFAYYASFKFQNTVICARLGSCYPQALLPPNHHGWRQKFIFIEEPFDRVNTARSVFDWCRFRQILDAFEETHAMLCKSVDLDLDRFLQIR